MGQAEQQHLDWLARSFGRPGYAPLKGSDSDLIRRTGEIVTHAPGALLFEEGEPATAAYLIERGEVEIFRGSGKSRRVVARVGPGSVLGDVAVFEDIPHIASARALTPVRVYRFDRIRLMHELAAQPAVLLRWMLTALQQLEESQGRVIRLMHKPVLGQVADLLSEEAASTDEVNISQTTIANLLGVSRQSVNEALGKLRDEGVVTTGYRTIRILDSDRLATLADA